MQSPSGPLARWLVGLALAGCAHGPTPTPARIAQVCPALAAQRSVPRGGYARAFLELASVRKGDLPRKLSKLKQEPVATQGVAGIVAEHEIPVPLRWDRCLDRNCELKLQRTLLVSAYLPRTANEPVRVNVLIREGVGEHAVVYNEQVETRDQQAAAFDQHAERTMMVVTPYLLADEADDKRLLACKQAGPAP